MWFLIVLGVILVGFLIGMLFVKSVMKKHMTECEPDEKRIEGGEKRALILYQPTRHDSCDNYAKQIAEGLHERGYDVTMNYASQKLEYDLESFDLLVFGTGAYANMGAMPVRRYLREHPFTRKQVVLFSVGSNLKVDAEIEQMKTEIGHGNILYQIKVSRAQQDVMEDFLTRLELDNPDFDSIPESEPEEDEEDIEEEE